MIRRAQPAVFVAAPFFFAPAPDFVALFVDEPRAAFGPPAPVPGASDFFVAEVRLAAAAARGAGLALALLAVVAAFAPVPFALAPGDFAPLAFAAEPFVPGFFVSDFAEAALLVRAVVAALFAVADLVVPAFAAGFAADGVLVFVVSVFFDFAAVVPLAVFAAAFVLLALSAFAAGFAAAFFVDILVSACGIAALSSLFVWVLFGIIPSIRMSRANSHAWACNVPNLLWFRFFQVGEVERGITLPRAAS